MIENVTGVPVQPNATGETVMVAVIGALVVLMAVKAAIFPVPFAANPTETLSFVQLNAVVPTVPVNVIAFVVAPLHNTWLAGVTTFGVGLTVMVNDSGVPVQPNAEGVTVIVAVIGALLVFVAVNAAIFPVPFAANPTKTLLFVQLNAVLPTVPVNVIALVIEPLHRPGLQVVQH